MSEIAQEDLKAKKQKDILALRFMNIANYVENIESNDIKDADGSWIDNMLTNYDMSKINDKRLKFYLEFFKTANVKPEQLKQMWNVYNDIKMRKKAEQNRLKNIVSLLKKYKKSKHIDRSNTAPDDLDFKSNLAPLMETFKQKYMTMEGDGITSGGKGTRGGKGDDDYIKKYIQDVEVIGDDGVDGIESIKQKVKDVIKPLSKRGVAADEGHEEENLRGQLMYKYNLDNLNNLTENIIEGTPSLNKEDNPIQNFIDDYYNAAYYPKDTKERKERLKNAVFKLEDSPHDVLQTLKISREDRLVFIITTFVIRYITMNLVQWCIDINFIKDFYQGFIMYAVIYCAFFWLIIMFVNVNTLPVVNYMHQESNIGGIRSLFYYFYMETNGISRLLTHTAIIIIMLLIPVFVNISYKKASEDDKQEFLSYEDKKKLLKVLSLLTIFLWLFTSIIAIKF